MWSKKKKIFTIVFYIIIIKVFYYIIFLPYFKYDHHHHHHDHSLWDFIRDARKKWLFRAFSLIFFSPEKKPLKKFRKWFTNFQNKKKTKRKLYICPYHFFHFSDHDDDDKIFVVFLVEFRWIQLKNQDSMKEIIFHQEKKRKFFFFRFFHLIIIIGSNFFFKHTYIIW